MIPFKTQQCVKCRNRAWELNFETGTYIPLWKCTHCGHIETERYDHTKDILTCGWCNGKMNMPDKIANKVSQGTIIICTGCGGLMLMTSKGPSPVPDTSVDQLLKPERAGAFREHLKWVRSKISAPTRFSI